MADLLGATNRVAGYESINNKRAQPPQTRPDDLRLQNVPDTTRVSRADGRTERQGADDPMQSGALRYDSNLQAFLQQLRDAPDLPQILSQVFTWLRSAAVTPGLTEGIAEEMASLLELLRMDQEGLLRFLTNQMQGGARFSGPLFSLLRQAYQNMPSDSARQAILVFLKRYNDFSATRHVAGNLLRTLRQISEYLPGSWRGQLLDLRGQLENGLQSGDRAGNLRLLRESILPYLGSYVEKTHDLGKARMLMGMLVLDMARYENGSEEGLLAAFRQLGGYGDILGGLNQLDDAALMKLMRENAFTQAAEADQFAEQLARTASAALQGRMGVDAREAFQEIVRAFLINESVYMPLNHLVIPLEWNGKALYSEVWVDPDAENGQNGQEAEEGKIQFLFKLDIASLGAMEITLGAVGGQVDLRVFGPEAVSGQSAVIAEDLKMILESHGLRGQSVQVDRLKTPLALQEVFPDLFEGKRSVNVKI